MPETKAMAFKISNHISRVFQVFNEQSEKAESAAGIKGPQLWAIKIIGDKSSIRITDLAALMYHHPSTLGGILDRLKAKGLVKRVRSFRDRRVIQVELTETGRKVQSNFPEIAQGMLVGSFEALSLDKLQIIDTGLHELVKILGARKLKPPPILAPEDVIKQGRKKTSQESIRR